MRYLSPVPIIKLAEFEIEDGFLVKINQFCKKNLAQNIDIECKKFYYHIASQNKGIYTCPYGFSVYYLGEYEAFIGLRVDKYYNQKATQKLNNLKNANNFTNPILIISSIENFANNYLNVNDAISKVEHLTTLLDQSIHEIASYNMHISANSGKLSNTFSRSKTSKKSDEYKLSRSIQAYSFMIERIKDEFALYGTDKTSITRRVILPYNHFETIRHCMEVLMEDRNIHMVNHSRCIQIPNINCNSSFLSVAFILIDNAFKYSSNSSTVDVYFDYSGKDLSIKIDNQGPMLEPDEFSKVFDMHFRGKTASKQKEGTGVGLYTAKKICEKYGIDLFINKEIMINRNFFSITIKIPESLIVKEY